MDFRRLAAKQKRIQEWTSAVQRTDVREDLRAEFVELLKEYRNLIAKCWEAEAVAENEASRLKILERRLQQMNEEARFFAA